MYKPVITAGHLIYKPREDNMKYITRIRNLVFVAAVFAFAVSANAQLVKKADLMRAWKTMADFSVGVAESMPEEQYAFTVDPIVRNFGDQMLHIAMANFLMASNLKADEEEANLELESKSAIIAELKRSNEYVAKALEKITLKELEEEVGLFDGSKGSRFRYHLGLIDHMTHTRGISISYLRAKGIAPPTYVGW